MLFPFILDGGASLPFFMFLVMTIACLCLSVVIGASNDLPAVAGKTMSMAFVTSPVTTGTSTKTKITQSHSLIRRVRTIHHHCHRASIRDNINEHIQYQESGSYSLLPLATMDRLSLQSFIPLHQSMITGDQSLVERQLRLGTYHDTSYLSQFHSLITLHPNPDANSITSHITHLLLFFTSVSDGTSARRSTETSTGRG